MSAAIVRCHQCHTQQQKRNQTKTHWMGMLVAGGPRFVVRFESRQKTSRCATCTRTFVCHTLLLLQCEKLRERSSKGFYSFCFVLNYVRSSQLANIHRYQQASAAVTRLHCQYPQRLVGVAQKSFAVGSRGYVSTPDARDFPKWRFSK